MSTAATETESRSRSRWIALAVIVAAAVTTIATAFTTHYVNGHPGTNPFSGSALTHGFEIAFYVLAAVAALGAALAAVMLEPRSAQPEPERGLVAVVEGAA